MSTQGVKNCRPLPSTNRRCRTTTVPWITRSRLQQILVVGIALSAFGPYVIGSIRTEQLLIYSIGALLLPFSLAQLQPGIGIGVMIAWLSLVAASLVGAIAPPHSPTVPESGSLLAGLDNLLLPIVVMMLVWGSMTTESARSSLPFVCRVFVWAAALNSLVALASVWFDLTPDLRVFWSADEGVSTAEKALGNGRATGIFNHPAEAGTFYGITGIMAVLLYANSLPQLLCALLMIVAGGVLSVSKVFIFLGLPLILLMLLATSTWLRTMATIGFMSIAVLLVAQTASTWWSGSDYLLSRILPGHGDGLLEFFTAGRWQSNSGNNWIIAQILNTEPIFGVGAAGWALPYDSAWVEVLVISGLFGLVAYLAALACLTWIAVVEVEGRYRLATSCFTALLIGGSFGISPLTCNRVAVICWLFISLVVRAHGLSKVRNSPHARVRGPVHSTI